MRHPVVIVLVVLLVLSLPVSVVGTAGSANVADDADDTTYQFQSPTITVDGDHAQLEGTPNRLVLHGERTTAYGTPTLDFGIATASQDDALRSDYRTFDFEAEFEDLESDENRSEVIVAELDRIERQIEELRERERTVAAAHATGDASENEVLRTIARNYYTAQHLQRALADLERRSDGIVDISDSVDTATAELETYQGPIRTEISSSLQGIDESGGSTEASPMILLKSGTDGLGLSMLDSNTYVSEMTRYDNRQPDRTVGIETMDEARDFAGELYPWAFETTSGTTTYKYGTNGHYLVEASSHDQGQLSVYVDGGTETIYHERQTLDVESVPIETINAMENEELNVTLKRTPGIAPAVITATDPADQSPINATVIVNGTTVGETGDDGQLWFVPPNDGFELSVQSGSTSLNATVAASN